MIQAYRDSREHLFEELHRLDLVLNLQVARQRRDPAYTGFDEFRGLFISEAEIDSLLGENKHPPSPTDRELGETALQPLLAAIEQIERQIAWKIKAALEQGVVLALPLLAQRFQLAPFDIDVLLICLAPELDLKYEKLYAYLQNDVTRKRPSVDLVLTLLCRSLAEKLQARTRLIRAAPLFKYQLITTTDDSRYEPSSLLARFLQLDDRILHYLLGIEIVDEPLRAFAQLITPDIGLEEWLQPAEIKENLLRCFQSRTAVTHNSIFLLQGPPGVGKKFTAQVLCRITGQNLLLVNLARLLEQKATQLLPRLVREARLGSAALYFDQGEALLAEEPGAVGFREALLQTLADFAGVAFIGSAQPWNAGTDSPEGAFFKVVFPAPTYTLRRQLWQTFIVQDGHRVSPGVDLDALADRFNFTAGKIRNALHEAGRLALLHDPDSADITTADLYQACRLQSSAKLGTLARKITPCYTWQDIILPTDRLAQLQELCGHVKYRQRVFESWGFNRRLVLGRGLSILFVGPSGTGKTMAAEIIAGELGLEIYKIDLSCVVSKYIGETEKNLSRIFQEAEQGNSILFFDEADAIFGKRSEVKDSHDRYANIEVNYLLQKMEEHEGIVILASNFQKNIDEAFTRRIRFVVEFPFPDERYRYRIWKSVFPADTPLSADIDFDFLAEKFRIAGGSIKNIALSAAFLAADNTGQVAMEHIIRATRREFQKMGRLCVKADFDHYFELVSNEEAA